MRSILLTILVLINSVAMAQTIKLFPDNAPNEKGVMQQIDDYSGNKVANESVLRISDVDVPTLTFYPASVDNNSGTTIIVNPGGGYNILAYNLEGTEICEWFNKQGINCVLLKYRVPRREGREKHEAPLQDLQRAISITRSNADKWNIDANKIGVLGFSAGAHLSVMASTSFAERTYPKVDANDEVSIRPDFCVLVYPAYLSGDKFGVSSEITISEKIPPTFIVQTQDDERFIDSSLFYYYALKEVGVPVSMNLYPSGGHGYGLRNTGHWVNDWPVRVMKWLEDIN